MSKQPEILTSVLHTWLSQKPSAWASMIGALSTFVLVIGSLIYESNFMNLASLMPASFSSVFEHHEFWRLWTSLFVHADAKHLLSNAFLFFILGTFLAGYFSLFVFPFLAFAMGGVINFFVLQKMSGEASLIGVSGVVFWMGGAWLVLYFLLDTKRTVFHRFLRSFGVTLLLFMPAEAFDPSTSYGSHTIGFILGVTCGGVYYLYHKKIFQAAEVREILVEDL